MAVPLPPLHIRQWDERCPDPTSERHPHDDPARRDFVVLSCRRLSRRTATTRHRQAANFCRAAGHAPTGSGQERESESPGRNALQREPVARPRPEPNSAFPKSDPSRHEDAASRVRASPASTRHPPARGPAPPVRSGGARCAPPERNALQCESGALRVTTANANPSNAMPYNVRTARTTRRHDWHRLARSRAASWRLIRTGHRPQSLAGTYPRANPGRDPCGAAGIDPVTHSGSDVMMPDMNGCGPTTSWQSSTAHPPAHTTEANVIPPNAMPYTVGTPHSAGLMDATLPDAMPYTVRTQRRIPPAYST